MAPKYYNIALVFMFLLASCSGNKKAANSLYHTSTVIGDITPDSIKRFNLNQDLAGKSLEELRLLKNLLYAKQGYCFMQADLRGYFTAHMQGYDSLMEARYWAEEDNEKKGSFPPIKLTDQEAEFVKKIEALEVELKKRNYVDRNGVRLANIGNIVNLFQFSKLPTEFMQMLDKNNFAIVPTDKMQLFHIYEENDYHQVPNFVTTDMYLQLYHKYFSYVLRSLEENKFIPIVTDLSEGCYTEAMRIASSESDKKVKSIAEYTAVFMPFHTIF